MLGLEFNIWKLGFICNLKFAIWNLLVDGLIDPVLYFDTIRA